MKDETKKELITAAKDVITTALTVAGTVLVAVLTKGKRK